MHVRLVVLALVSSAALACGLEKSPTAATPIAAPLPPPAAPPLPTAVPGVLSIALPIVSGDAAGAAFGLIPFGYHGGGHTEDGHAGWDIEYRIGAPVRAAASGVVISVAPDPISPGRIAVVLEHVVGEHFYRTHYTNLSAVTSDVLVNEVILAGQAIGAAGTVTTIVGDTPVTYAMTHFQVDDLEHHREIANPKAVSPEPFLNAAGKALFDRIWAGAIYLQEFVEPFPSNAREHPVIARTWMRAGGDGPPGVRFTRRGTVYTYELLAESGTAVEAGDVVLRQSVRPPTIDLISPTATRRGIYDVVSGEMRLTIASPGAGRPAALDSTHVYRTR